MSVLTRVFAALSLLLPGLLPAAAVAQSTDATTVDVAILDVLRARGIIDEPQYEELLALAREKAAAATSEIDLIEGRLARLRAPDASVTVDGGKPGKLTFKSADGKWSMNLKGRLQTRVQTTSSDSDTKDGTNFSVARARLGFEGNAGAENVTYKFEVDFSTNSSNSSTSSTKNPQLRSGYINWGFENGLNLEFGQFKFPYSRETLTSSANLEFADRSIAAKAFAPEYEPGAMLHGTLNDGEWEYYAAASNGQGAGANNPAGDDQNGLRSGARIVWNPFGPTQYQGPAFQTVDDGETKLALGASFNQNKDSTGTTTVTPGADTDSTGLEAQLFSGPWSLLAEYYGRSSNLAGAPSTDDDGSTVQVGWFLVPDAWELVARHSDVNMETSDDQTENTIGVNYYVARQAGKWQLNLGRMTFDGSSPDQDQITLQYQLIF